MLNIKTTCMQVKGWQNKYYKIVRWDLKHQLKQKIRLAKRMVDKNIDKANSQ